MSTGGREPLPSSEHVVVGVDDQEASRRAVEWVAERRLGPHSVIEAVAVVAGRGDPADDAPWLASAVALLRAAHPSASVSARRLYGPPDVMLVDAAAEADLLVIGSRRQHRVRTALDGWLPERIPTSSRIPVVVVPEDWRRADGDVLVGVDEETGQAALGFAAAEAVREHRRLALLRAWRLPVASATGALGALEDPHSYEEFNRDVLHDAERVLRLRYPELRYRSLLEEGGAGDRMVAHAESATLVVVGRRHRSALGGVLFGSTAHELVNGSRTPVCVVPGHRPDDGA